MGKQENKINISKNKLISLANEKFTYIIINNQRGMYALISIVEI